MSELEEMRDYLRRIAEGPPVKIPRRPRPQPVPQWVIDAFNLPVGDEYVPILTWSDVCKGGPR